MHRHAEYSRGSAVQGGCAAPWLSVPRARRHHLDLHGSSEGFTRAAGFRISPRTRRASNLSAVLPGGKLSPGARRRYRSDPRDVAALALFFLRRKDETPTTLA